MPFDTLIAVIGGWVVVSLLVMLLLFQVALQLKLHGARHMSKADRSGYKRLNGWLMLAPLPIALVLSIGLLMSMQYQGDSTIPLLAALIIPVMLLFFGFSFLVLARKVVRRTVSAQDRALGWDSESSRLVPAPQGRYGASQGRSKFVSDRKGQTVRSPAPYRQGARASGV